MKILILVLSCKTPPYYKLHEAQRATWDSVAVEGVETMYYWNDDFDRAFFDYRNALGDALRRNWDFLFRTNSSSYVDKKLLVEVATKLPRKSCYAGVDGGGFASGSGFFLSRDLVEYLHLSGLILPSWKSLTGDQDDVLTGLGLAQQHVNLIPLERYDFYARGEDPEAIRKSYHVRCKGSDIEREDDVAAMRIVHGVKTKESP